MPAEACASTTYSDDEFELSLSGVSSVFGVGDNDNTGPNTRESHEEEEEEEEQGAGEREVIRMEPTTAVVPNENGDHASDHGADVSEAGYSSFGEEAPLPVISPSFTGVGERDGRTTKQVG